MTRHGLIPASAVGAPPPTTDPRASAAITSAAMPPSGPVPGRQYRAKGQRGDLSASNSAIPSVGRAYADIGRSSKSP